MFYFDKLANEEGMKRLIKSIKKTHISLCGYSIDFKTTRLKHTQGFILSNYIFYTTIIFWHVFVIHYKKILVCVIR